MPIYLAPESNGDTNDAEELAHKADVSAVTKDSYLLDDTDDCDSGIKIQIAIEDLID